MATNVTIDGISANDGSSHNVPNNQDIPDIPDITDIPDIMDIPDITDIPGKFLCYTLVQNVSSGSLNLAYLLTFFQKHSTLLA